MQYGKPIPGWVDRADQGTLRNHLRDIHETYCGVLLQQMEADARRRCPPTPEPRTDGPEADVPVIVRGNGP
jgi:hypothetical protein